MMNMFQKIRKNAKIINLLYIVVIIGLIVLTSPFLFLPSITSPLFGSISPAKIFKKVDFPAPLAPIKP